MKRRVLITGVTRGLGRAMLDRFLEAGCDVRGCGRSTSDIDVLNSRSQVDTPFAVVDVTDAADVDRWAEQLHSAGFLPDLLINNAGVINEPAPLWEVAPDDFAAVLAVNVTGTYHVIRSFVPAMIEQGSGVIVNFSSGWGRSTSPEVAPYCASKWGVEGMTRSLADELPAGLAAVALNPGVINTDMLQQCWGVSADSYPSPEQWSRRAVPYLLSLGPGHNGQSLSVP